MFRKLINVETVQSKIINFVDSQEHVKYFKDRQTSWLHIKGKHTQELTQMIVMSIEKYIDLFTIYSDGSEKYGNLLAAWYKYVGSWAVHDLSGDQQRQLWTTITLTQEISSHNRSCLIHSIFNGIFSSMSNIMDAAQSKLFHVPTVNL